MALLAAGDLAVLLAFAAVGRHSHGEPLTLSDTFNTALPFIIGETHQYSVAVSNSIPGLRWHAAGFCLANSNGWWLTARRCQQVLVLSNLCNA